MIIQDKMVDSTDCFVSHKKTNEALRKENAALREEIKHLREKLTNYNDADIDDVLANAGAIG